jgi:hypothetical protein
MKPGMFTVMMSDQPLEKVLDLAVGYGMEAVESFYCSSSFTDRT